MPSQKPYSFITLPSNPNGRNIGLYGGSFNPAHMGHLHLSLQAIKTLKLDEVWWIISPQNPLKNNKDIWPIDKRIQTIKQIANHSKIKITNFETQLNNNYTHQSLAYLCKRFPNANFIWLMGADNLTQISQWHHWQRIFKHMPIAIFDRSTAKHASLNAKAALKYQKYRINPNQSQNLANHPPPAWCFLHIKRLDIASSQLRDKSPK